MFNCEICKETSKPCEPQYLEVASVVIVDHPERTYYVGSAKSGHKVNDPGGRGPQIIRQRRVCYSCYRGVPKAAPGALPPDIETDGLFLLASGGTVML